jgi:hypothetical protein
MHRLLPEKPHSFLALGLGLDVFERSAQPRFDLADQGFDVLFLDGGQLAQEVLEGQVVGFQHLGTRCYAASPSGMGSPAFVVGGRQTALGKLARAGAGAPATKAGDGRLAVAA